MSNTRGLYNKFSVIRNDGQSESCEKHCNCSYFVIDLDHDPLASSILRSYAEQTSNINLRDDLIREAIEIEDRRDKVI